MALTPEEVRRLAALARLDLAADEVERLAAQLSDILTHADGLPPLPEDERPPAERPPAGLAPDAAPLREDVPGPDPLACDPADLAPEWRDGLFTVPRLPSHDPPAREGP